MKKNFRYFIFCFCVTAGNVLAESDVKNVRFSCGTGMGGGSNASGLVLVNIMAQIEIDKFNNISFMYMKGSEFYTGVDAPHYEKREMDYINFYKEIGIIYSYDFGPTLTTPYIGAGLSYIKGETRDSNTIRTIGFPFEVGANIKIFKRLMFGIGYIGCMSSYSSLNSFIVRIIF